jgi:hypothetical protein
MKKGIIVSQTGAWEKNAVRQHEQLYVPKS